MNVSVSFRRQCVALGMIVVAAASCAEPETALLRDVPSVQSQGGLRYEAFQEASGPQAVLRAGVRVTNDADSAVTLEAPGGCPLRLLLYGGNRRNADTSAVWDSLRDRRDQACIMSGQLVPLGPSQDYAFYAEATAEELEKAGVPAGAYQLLVRFEANPQLGLLNGGTFYFMD